jgi:hypothetical protein
MNKIRFILLGVFLVAGCAGTGERKIQVEPRDFSNYLNQQKNVMTYDQAIKEWGLPGRVTQSIGFFVATWSGELEIPSTLSEDTATRGVVVVQTRNLQLAFDKETQKMLYWRTGG